MKIALNLAWKNLIRAGLRTWLNVAVLSFVFVLIVFYNAFINGWQNQAEIDCKEWEFGNGLLVNNKYEKDNPFTYQDGHDFLPEDETQGLIPVLVQQGTIYPRGRMLPVIIKGIPDNQQIIKIPGKLFSDNSSEIQGIIGMRMANAAKLKVGDKVLLRWRDKNGTFDAANVSISEIFNTTVVTVDVGQIWLPLDKLRTMTGLQNETSYFVVTNDFNLKDYAGWSFVGLDVLLKDLHAAVNMERASSMIIFLVLFAIGLLAIFDTQVLSIFRRQKEIGTMVALGMTRKQVLRIFTVEGFMYSVFSVFAGLIYGLPIFIYTALKGIGMPKEFGEMGVALSNRIFPVYNIELILITILLITISATFVSYLPAHKITKMNTVNALKGKMI